MARCRSKRTRHNSYRYVALAMKEQFCSGSARAYLLGSATTFFSSFTRTFFLQFHKNIFAPVLQEHFLLKFFKKIFAPVLQEYFILWFCKNIFTPVPKEPRLHCHRQHSNIELREWSNIKISKSLSSKVF